MDLDKLRTVLYSKRITQVALAKCLGVTVKTANAKLNGRSPITVDEAFKIVKLAKIKDPMPIFFVSRVAKMRQKRG